MTDTNLDKLFPIPSVQPPSPLSPRPWPGSTPESTAALREVLQDNHRRWHVFFDDVGRHNHSAHHMLAIWTLGADENVIRAAYASNCEYMKPAFESPGPVTKENFMDHIGDPKYYNSFLRYFQKELETRNVSDVIEEYVFSQAYNFDPVREAAGKSQPLVLCRFLDALVHPLIHVGYGLELSIPGMVVEGLASAVVHRSNVSALVKPALFDSFGDSYKGFTSAMSLALNKILSSSPPKSPNVHALTVIARVHKDARFNGFKPSGILGTFREVTDRFSEELIEYANQWTLDIGDPEMISKKFEELVWAFTIIYGICGWKGDKSFQADFLNMHLITSSLFLPSILAYLSPRSQGILLRSHFQIALAWWVGHGRGELDIKGFYQQNTAHPVFPGPHPTPLKGVFPSPSSPSAITPNPWLPIIQSAVVHTDEHLPKLQRALAHFALLYGNRVAGLPDFVETELEGAECLDGSLFVRVASATAEFIGRMREGESGALVQGKGHQHVADFWSFDCL